ncbi:MAG TPA: metallophosphoesterase [Alphaproteobacteria bacterium]|nr:metallophosphoesterase [Alphaproteobacteria bacterium]
MMITRANFLRGLVATTALPLTARAAPHEVEALGQFQAEGLGGGAMPFSAKPGTGAAPLRFAVIGDNTGIARPGVFDAAMTQIGWLKPDFILSVGDLIEGYNDDKATIARQWDAIERSIAKAGVPFIHTPGNHDVNNPVTLDAWRERRGPGYYAFTYKGALFIILNTEDPPTPMAEKAAAQFYSMVDLMAKDPDKAEKTIGDYIAGSTAKANAGAEYADADKCNISDRQLAFVRDTLARHEKVAWTFVILHKPAWKMASPAFARIQAMLGQRPYTVFAGHTHYFTHDVLDGHDLINMATTGGIKQQNGPGTLDHTMLVTLEPAGPRYANIRLSGLMDVAGASGQVHAY